MLLTPINVPLVSLKVLIQNERTQWFTDGALRSAFVQGIVRVGYSPSLFYYELLLMIDVSRELEGNHAVQEWSRI